VFPFAILAQLRHDGEPRSSSAVKTVRETVREI
jgi:hypothetical protein